jgi:hypothetical protein
MKFPDSGLAGDLGADGDAHKKIRAVVFLLLPVIAASIACGRGGGLSTVRDGVGPSVDVGSDGAVDKAPGTEAGVDATVLGPCNPETDTVRCDGKNFSTCTCTKEGPQVGIDLAGGPLYSGCDSSSWVQQTTCSVACDLGLNPSSGCVLSEQPIPECAQHGTDWITCWNGNQTWCLNGYPLPTTPCPAGTACTLVPGCPALCLSSSATKDPRCPDVPGVANDFCSENVAYFCSCGYLTGSEACGADPNNGCVTVPSYDGFDHVQGQTAMCGLLP